MHKFHSLSVFSGITGSLHGTASFAQTASYAQSVSGFVRFPDGLTVTGSLNVTGSITGSLLGTASWASNAVSSSYAGTASVFLGTAVSASYAQTASVALNVDGFVNFPNGLDVTGSLNVSGSITGSLLGTSSWATNAVSSSFATTASYATTAQNVLGSITSASYAATASLLLGSVESASFATTASAATSITFTPATASFAISASWAPYGGLVTKVGSIANTTFAGNPRNAPVNFTTPFVNTSYAVVITGEDSRAWSIEGKVVGGFTASANSNTALAGTTYWVATAYGEV